MSSMMSKFFKSSIFGSLALVILGILLIFQSEATIISISYIIGGILVAIGALAIVKYLKNTKSQINSGLDMVYGVVTVILGVIVITNPAAIASIIPFVIGFIIIINSARKLQYSIELKNNENELWKSTMIIAFITTIFGVVLVINPFKGVVFITKIVGILITLYSVLDIISTITIKNTLKEIHSAIEETITDAQVVDEKTTKKEKKKTSKKNKKGDE